MNMKKIAENVVLGRNVVLNDFINLYGCRIDDESRVGPFVEIQKNAFIGKRCKIQSHTFICEGVTIEDEVFVGHGVMFINDKIPRAVNETGLIQREADWKVVPTLVKKGASIGSNATIMCGITIGENAVIGAGSVVLSDVPDHAVAAGNPAGIIRRLKAEKQG